MWNLECFTELHSGSSYIFMHSDASWEWWHRSILRPVWVISHQQTPRLNGLKQEGLFFPLMTRALWLVWRSAPHCPYLVPYFPQLVGPLLSSVWLLPWQQTGNMAKYILVHKVEVKHFTSAHRSVVQTKHTTTPNFLGSPRLISANITNNFHSGQAKKD